MKLEKFDKGSLRRETIEAETPEVTITTSRGSFGIRELEDGSLSIHEASHFRLAVHPRTANSIVLEAVDPL